jgi:phospholipase/carboxylesterase
MGGDFFSRFGIITLLIIGALVIGTWAAIAKPYYPIKTFESADGSVRFEYVERFLGGAFFGEELPLVVALGDGKYSARQFAGTLSKVTRPCLLIVLRPFISDNDTEDAWYREDRIDTALPAAVETVAGYIKAFTAEEPPMGKPIVYGYSQGANVIQLFGLEYPELTAHVIACGGYLPPQLLPKANLFWVDFPHFTILHGVRDHLYPILTARTTLRALEERKIPVTLIEYAEVHKLSFEMRRDIASTIDQAIEKIMAGTAQ